MLARAIQPVLVLNGLWDSWEQVISYAYQAAQGGALPGLFSWALHERGTRAGLLGDMATAASDLEQALQLRLDAGDTAAAAITRHNMEYLGLLPPPPTPPDPPEAPSGRRLAWLKPMAAVIVPFLIATSVAVAGWFNPNWNVRLTVEPTEGSYREAFQFNASLDSDTDSDNQVTYIWDFGDGSDVTETTDPAIDYVYDQPGVYMATLSTRDQQGNMSETPATVQVTVRNEAPRPTIERPDSQQQFRADHPIHLVGSATDYEDGELSADDLRWEVKLYNGDDIQTLLPVQSGEGVTATVPQSADIHPDTESYLEIQLMATDTLSETGVVTQVLFPEMVAVTLHSEPSDIPLTADGRTESAPWTVDVWSGSLLQLAVPDHTDSADICQVFASWSDDGAATHPVTVTAATAYTATFRALTVGFDTEVSAVNEGDGVATLTVALDAETQCQVQVDYATRDGSATAGEDYAVTTGTLTFAPGVVTQSIEIPITDNQRDEADETIELVLGDPAGAEAGTRSSHTLTIQDDDEPPTVGFIQSGFTIDEEAGAAEIAVALDAASGRPITIEYVTEGNTATDGDDFTSTSGTLTFVPGETSQTFSVPIIADPTNEPNELITLILSSPEHTRLGASEAILIIENDDPPPTVQFDQPRYSMNENVAASAESIYPLPSSAEGVAITVVLDQPSAQAVTVDYTTVNDTATARRDYVATRGTLTFQPGEVRQTFTVRSIDDRLYEGNEVLTLRLSNPVNAVLGTATADLIIVENDPRDTTGPRLGIPSIEPETRDVGIVVSTCPDQKDLLTFRIAVSDPSGVDDVELRYLFTRGEIVRLPDELNANQAVVMRPGTSSSIYEAVINGSNVIEGSGTFSYQIVATDNVGNRSEAQVYSQNARGSCNIVR
jgi:PKD repeat protein